MSRRELVPNTPTSTAPQQPGGQSEHVESVGQSYLWSALGGLPAAAGGEAATGPEQGHSNALETSSLAGEFGAHDETDPDVGREEEDEEVVDSQASPAKDADQVDELDSAEHSHHSQPQHGPEDDFRLSQLADEVAESLGRTLHEHETFKRHPRQSRVSRDSNHHSSNTGKDDGTGEDSGPSASAAVSMDLTKANGRVLHAQPPNAGHPTGPTDTIGLFEETVPSPQITAAQELDAGAPGQSDSQKEKASPSRSAPPSRPSSAAAVVGEGGDRGSSGASALGVRNSRVNLDDQNGPSSSPAIERELLGAGRLSASRRPPFQTGASTDPASSADPDLSPNVLLSPRKAANTPTPLEASSGAHVQMSFAGAAGEMTANSQGPIVREIIPTRELPLYSQLIPKSTQTSTPAFLNAQPPDPSMTATRTIPNLAISSVDDSVRLSRHATEPAIASTAPFATSSAMRTAPPTKQKKRREPWDDLSQDSSKSLVESQASVQQSAQMPESAALRENSLQAPAPPAQRIEPSLNADVDTRNGTDDDGHGPHEDAMSIDEPLAATVPHEDSLEAGASAARPSAETSGAVRQATAYPHTSFESGPRRPTGQPALFASESATSSPSQASVSQPLSAHELPPNASAPEQKGKKRLSDISELRSSSEIPPTQYEVAATQQDYDVFRSSEKSQEAAFDNSDRWHASFQVPDKAEASHARKSPSPTVRPAPGRALKRQPPPSSPVRNGALPAAATEEDEAPESRQFDDADESARPTEHHQVDVSTMAQATQRMNPVPESSPDVPLAKRARRIGPLKPAVTFAADVIPDSDGASVPEPVAGPSKVAANPADDEADELSPLGSPRRPPLASTSNATGKGKGKAATTGTKGKGRGRGRVLDSTESHDVLDSLAESKSAAALPEETNYDEPPTTRNAKRTTRRTSRGDRNPSPVPGIKTNIVDKGKRRANETSAGEDEGGGLPPRRKKRKASRPSADFDLDVFVDAPRSSQSASSPKSTRNGSVAPPPTTVKLAAATKKKSKAKADPKRRSMTADTSARRTASPAVETEPLSGPSRRRSAPVDGAGREASVPDEKPKVSRLPKSAPFRRVFGLWRDDHCFYSGTIESASPGSFSVRFDDTNRGKLLASEIRYCRLEKGDRVMYIGRDSAGPPDGRQQLVVEDVERTEPADGESGVDAPENESLRADDVVTVSSPDGTQYRVPVKTLFVPGNRTPQLENRRPKLSELSAFDEAKANEVAQQVEPKLCPAPKPFSLQAMEVSKVVTTIFSRTAFITTKADRLNDSRSTLELTRYGATMIDWPHLFRVRAPADPKAPPEVEFQTDDFAEIDEIFLLSDKHCSTPKYLAALALGIPCLSPDFATQSVKENTRLPWQQFVLPAGHLQCLDTVAIGAMYRAVTKTSFDLGSLERAYRNGGVFAGCSFLVVRKPYSKAKPDTKEKELAQRHLYQIYALVACASARQVDFTASIADAKSAARYDFVLLLDDPDSLPALLRPHKGLVTVTWVKQCLVAGRLLPPARLKDAVAGSTAADHE
ncbi:hypothetical protein JCM3774_000992 [Rhodotorula dairenensis]